MKKKVIIASLIIILIIAWVAVAYSKNNDEKGVNTQAIGSPSTQSNNSVDSAAQANGGNNKLKITQLGAQITLPQELQGDISYRVTKTPVGGDRYDFESAKFNQSNFKCQVADTNEGKVLVSIYKESGTEDGQTTDPAPFKTLNSDRYYFAGSSCEEAISESGSDSDKTLINQLKSALTSSLEQISGN